MTNVGSKIKTLVAVVTILGLISCLGIFIVGTNAYTEDKEYLEYATAYGGAYGYPSLQAAGDNAYNGLQLRKAALPLALAIAIGALPLYGFGVIVENSEKQTELLSTLAEEQEKTNAHLENLQKKAVPTVASKKCEVEQNVSDYLPEL